MPLAHNSLDDEPLRERVANFAGVDMATDPRLLPAEIVQEAVNMLFRGDGIARSRPGLAFNSNAATPATSATLWPVRGMLYYDLPDYECTLAIVDNHIVEITSAGNSVSAANVGTFSPAGTGTIYMVQMIDRAFWLAGGYLFWAIRVAGVWTTGGVVAFSDGSSMPTWGRIATQNFRLLLMEAQGYKLYASAVGQAHNAADWVKTDNLRVGSGEGDPARAVVAGQAGFVTMLNARSVYQLDMSASSVASWTSLRVTGLVGCVEGRTAVTIGQDVFFLARHGVVSLGALAASDSISPQATLSAPIRPIIDRINWSAIDKAWAVQYREYYLLALPLDGDTRAKYLFAYNTLTRQWSGTWSWSAAWLARTNAVPGPGTASFGGFTCGVVANFGDKAETLIADDTGRVFRFDEASVSDYAGPSDTEWKERSLKTRALTLGAPDDLKQPLQVEVEWMHTYITSGSIALTVDPLDTEATSTLASGTLGATPTTNLQRQRLLARGVRRFRNASITLSATAGETFNVRSVALTGFLDHGSYT